MRPTQSILIGALLAFSMTDAAGASPRELSQFELRIAAGTGQAIGLKRILEGVTKLTGGKALDARAFKSDDVFYRVLVKKPSGQVTSIIVNATTGKVVSKKSAIGKQIDALASKPAVGTGKSGSPGNANKAEGADNRGGNGRGNGGGGGKGGRK